MSKEAENLNSAVCSGTLWERRQRHQEVAVIDAANALIEERGFEAMTMDDLADRAGISKPTLYKRFPSKEAVAVRAIIHLMEDGLRGIQALPTDWSAWERFSSTIRWILEKRLMEKRIRFGSAKAMLVPVIRTNPDYRRAFDAVTQTIQQIVEQAQQDGDIDPDLDSRIVSQTPFSLARDSEYEELITSGQCDARKAVDTLTGILLRGVRIEGNAG
jgi:AcrR family transcriptional regulator